MGTADDVIVSLNNFTRNVAITPLTDISGNPIGSMVGVTITINYTTPGRVKSYVLTDYISQYH